MEQEGTGIRLEQEGIGTSRKGEAKGFRLEDWRRTNKERMNRNRYEDIKKEVKEWRVYLNEKEN